VIQQQASLSAILDKTASFCRCHIGLNENCWSPMKRKSGKMRQEDVLPRYSPESIEENR
jgi:hypothetical protein